MAVEQAQEQTQEQAHEGKALIMERIRLHLTQAALAQSAGLTESAYIQIEKGRVRPRLVNAQRIIDALNEAREAKGETEKLDLYSLAWSPQGLPPRK